MASLIIGYGHQNSVLLKAIQAQAYARCANESRLVVAGHQAVCARVDHTNYLTQTWRATSVVWQLRVGVIGVEALPCRRVAKWAILPPMEFEHSARTYVAGHRGLVGSAIWRELQRQGYRQLIGRSHAELDLLDAVAVEQFFARERPEFVFVAAARVGGIQANDTRPAEFLYENLQIQNNLIHHAWRGGVKKLLFLGSSCIYPKHAPQPMNEDHLLTGPLEPTNQWYAVAKIAGIKMCQAYRRQRGCNFISAMPTNMYGPNDNFDLQSSHVLPALVRKFHEAKASHAPTVTCWGTGGPKREFLYADDLARACVFLMQQYNEEQFINIGFGSDVTIQALAHLVREIVGFQGEIVWDASMPDGTPRKLLDSSRLFALGWRPRVELEAGIRLVYEDFLRRFA